MEHFILQVTRKEEEEVDHFWDIISANLEKIEPIESMNVKKYRIGMETIYSVAYQESI